ncbi:MAG: RES family NAD+ phosphorylase [Gammaproteobacteria bacterium]
MSSIRPRHLKRQRATEVEMPDSLVETVGRLPRDWKTNMRTTQQIGDRWIASGATPVLAVPSALYECRGEQPLNYLLNPNHPGFDRLDVGRFANLNVDPRIV